MQIHHCEQGSPEWLALRAGRFCASEAPAMMGASRYTSRSELLAIKSGAAAPAEVDRWKQRLFDDGHAAEAAFRPIAERLIGDDLYPVTGTVELDDLPLLASFDGLTMTGDTGFEHKLWNAELADLIQSDNLDPHWYWQLEHQLLVSGAESILFATSDGTEQKFSQMRYRSRPERRALLIAGWKQFAEDLASFKPVKADPVVVATPAPTLPALTVTVEGRVVASNLVDFTLAARKFIAAIRTDLKDDQDFADAEAMVKACEEGEKRLEVVKAQALAQTASIDELFGAIDSISADLRAKRLTLSKLVTARKSEIRNEIIQQGGAEFAAHIERLNKRIGGNWMPAIDPGLAAAIKNKRTLASVRDAVNTALAHAKIAANEVADRIEENRKMLAGDAHDWSFLFPDFGSVAQKSAEDFANLLGARIASHEQRVAEQRAAEAAAAEATRRAAQSAAQAVQAEPTASAPAAKVTPVDTVTRETQNTAIVDNEPAIREFLASRDFGSEANRVRAILVEYEKFKAVRNLRRAA